MNPLQISIAIWFSSSDVRMSQVPRPQSHSNSTHRTGRDNAASYLSGRVSSLKVSSERFAVLLFIKAGPQRGSEPGAVISAVRRDKGRFWARRRDGISVFGVQFFRPRHSAANVARRKLLRQSEIDRRFGGRALPSAQEATLVGSDSTLGFKWGSRIWTDGRSILDRKML